MKRFLFNLKLMQEKMLFQYFPSFPLLPWESVSVVTKFPRNLVENVRSNKFPFGKSVPLTPGQYFPFTHIRPRLSLSFLLLLFYIICVPFPPRKRTFLLLSLFRPATARPPQTSLPPLELVPELIQHHHNHPTHSSMSPSTTRTEPAVPLSPPERVLVRVCGCLAIAHLIIEQT